MSLLVYSDGASRGNPGRAAIAFLILDDEGVLLQKHSQCIGLATNNQAEYTALASALEAASKLTHERATCHIDSELVAKQLIGEYEVRDMKLREYWLRVRELEKRFREITYVHLPRENCFISQVDELANQALDQAEN